MKLDHIFIASGHAYFGRYGKAPSDHPITEIDRAECVQDMGLRGDRFFGHKDNYKGQVTFFSTEVWEQLVEELHCPTAVPSDLRRNLLVSGTDLNALIGSTFEFQGISFEGVEECRPCFWMDRAITDGAEAWLKGRGGLRCRVLSSGWLHTARTGSGPFLHETTEPLASAN